jgi:hypothetical protein
MYDLRKNGKVTATQQAIPGVLAGGFRVHGEGKKN